MQYYMHIIIIFYIIINIITDTVIYYRYVLIYTSRMLKLLTSWTHNNVTHHMHIFICLRIIYSLLIILPTSILTHFNMDGRDVVKSQHYFIISSHNIYSYYTNHHIYRAHHVCINRHILSFCPIASSHSHWN